jgi:hypothetical protein
VENTLGVIYMLVIPATGEDEIRRLVVEASLRIKSVRPPSQPISQVWW